MLRVVEDTRMYHNLFDFRTLNTPRTTMAAQLYDSGSLLLFSLASSLALALLGVIPYVVLPEVLLLGLFNCQRYTPTTYTTSPSSRREKGVVFIFV
jgi:hypothetical protein